MTKQTKTKIELNEVATVIERRGLEAVDPRNVTLFDAQAKVIAISLTGKQKPFKQDLEQVKTHLTTLWGGKAEQTIADIEDEADGVDDFRTESDAGQAELAAEGDDEAAGDDDGGAKGGGEAEGEAEAEDGDGDGDGDEAKPEASVVKRKYRDRYKQQGHARGNGDWLFMATRALCNGAKQKLLFDNWQALCEANNLGRMCAEYATPSKQLNNGWQGRNRMSVGIKMREVVAQEAVLIVPKDLWEASAERIAKANAEGSKWAFHIELDDTEDDAIVVLRAPQTFTQEVLAKVANRSKE